MKRRIGGGMSVVIGVAGVLLGIGGAPAQAPARAPATAGKPAAGGLDWPRWRGPDGNGISKDTRWNPAALKDAKPVWKVNVGEGFSSVSIEGQRLFTMGFKDGNDIVWCRDAGTGAEVWKHSYPCERGEHPGPRCTPTVDGGFVYTFSRKGNIFCLKESDGSVVWQKNAMSDFQAGNLQWGLTSSPHIEGDELILNAGPCGLALKKKTGEKVWSSGAGVGGYAAAVPYTLAGKRCVVIFSQNTIRGADLKTGEQKWSHPWKTDYDVNAADPIVSGSHVFLTSGYNRGCALLDISAGTPKVVYENKALASHFSSPVLIAGHIYGMTGNTGGGQLVCLDFKTGAEKWKQNLGFGSLTAVGDKLIVLTEKGTLFVVEASPAGYKEVASAKDVIGATCWTSPVFCRGFIYCRNNTGDLVAVDVSK